MKLDCTVRLWSLAMTYSRIIFLCKTHFDLFPNKIVFAKKSSFNSPLGKYSIYQDDMGDFPAALHQ